MHLSTFLPHLPDVVNQTAKGRRSVADDAVRDAVELGSHLQFLDKLIRAHDWQAHKQQNFVGAAERIRKREQDPRLFLGIVGEFNSGKSTLINALLRARLLRADIIPETTSAATVASFGSDLDVEVVLRDGTRHSYRKDGAAVLRKLHLPTGYSQEQATIRSFLDMVTANEEIARHVTLVNLVHSAERLREGLVLVDTPGVNATNPRHVEITGRALREICDAALVIVPADVPLAESLCAFLQNHLADVLHRCIFVVTKIDKVALRDRQRLLDNVKSRAERKFSLASACVVALAPQLVLDDLFPNADSSAPVSRLSAEERVSLVQQFPVVEKSLWNIVGTNRTLIQLERLSKLLTEVLEDVRNTLKEHTADYRRRHQALEENRLPDPAQFIQEHKLGCTEALASVVPQIQDEVSAAVSQLEQQILGEVQQAINSTTFDNLQPVVQSLPDAVKQAAQDSVREIMSQAHAALVQVAGQIHGIFHDNFAGIYQNLATLGGEISMDSAITELSAEPLVLDNFSSHAGSLVAQFQTDQDEVVGNAIGGAGVGAIIGTVLLPGIGTVVGGFLGGLFGAAAGPDLPQLQHKYWCLLRDNIQGSFSSIQYNVRTAVADAGRTAVGQLERLVEQYLDRYERLINAMIERDRSEQCELQRLDEKAQQGIREIQERLTRLESAQKQLRSMQGHSASRP